ncbi:hypothetical protein HPB47_025837 [Ixodes persulcatus]|uniref:Uncharacterized protein n=1 Tax=Ixodes persulcatus TaxID=34615 RepID=A0AC60Q0T8_IXOPE|nr:hypothetical protein HPB47_025837 [Ixodes persulcatus]
MSTKALLFSSRTGYDPDKVAFDSINPAARPLYTNGIQKTASEEQVGTLPGNSWVQVLHRKKTQKKEVHDQRKEDRGPTGGATEVKKKETKKPFRLPSLRELKHKIIVKPRKAAVDLKSCRDQIGEAVQNSLPRGLSENSVVRLLEEQNTIMICTDIWDEAEALAKLRSLIFPSGQLDVEAYHVSPRDEACRGVIHGVRPELSNAQIKEKTKAPGHEILDARRLGRSKSALVTFAGTKVPVHGHVQLAGNALLPIQKDKGSLPQLRRGRPPDGCVQQTDGLRVCDVRGRASDGGTPVCPEVRTVRRGAQNIRQSLP